MSRDYISTRELLNRMGKGAMDAAKRALAESAEAVKTEAKSRCPVYRGRDKRVVSGALRDSIHCVKRGRRLRGVPSAGRCCGLFGKVLSGICP